jgi:drug/metabolite transporter (DMT)-like permease
MKLSNYTKIILAAVIWSTSGIFIKKLGLPATTLSFFRVAVPTFILLGFFLIKQQSLFRDASWQLWVASLLNAGRLYLVFAAFLLTTISTAIIMLFSWPVFTAIFGRIFLKERLSTRKKVLIVLPFMGVILMYLSVDISLTNTVFLGLSAALLSAVLNALSMVIFKNELRNHSQFKTVFYQNLIGTFVFLPFLFMNSPFPSVQQVSGAAVWAFLVGLVGYGLFFAGLKRIKVSIASSLAYLEVPLAILWGVLIFKDALTVKIIVGGLLIVVSTMLLKRSR